MKVNTCSFIILLLCGTLLLQACEEKSSSGRAPLQPVATLPSEFVDNLGETWLCEDRQFNAEITGTVRLQSPAEPPQNPDILHIALFEQSDEQLISLNSYCVNNINKFPVAFALGYDATAIKNQARYVIRANYFRSIAGNLYEASHKPDGSTEVISNGRLEQIDITIKSVGF